MTYSEMVTRLEAVVAPEFIDLWARTPNKMLGGRSPAEALDMGDFRQIERLIFFLESGQPI